MASKRAPDLVDRDQQILSRLARIEHKVDSLEQTTAFALRADDERHQDTVRTIFRQGKRRSQVYLAANGERTVQDIARHLGILAQNTSRELSVLKAEGLLELVESSARGDIYAKKPVDRSLRISRFLCGEYDLDNDGLPSGTRGRAKTRAKKRPRTTGASPHR